MLYLHESTDIFSLSGAWKKQVTTPLVGTVLQPRTVIVPNMDIASWLQVNLAENEGIAANIDFQLPAGFFRSQFEKMDPKVRSSLLDKPTLHWMIFTLLGEMSDTGEYPVSWDVLIDWMRRSGNKRQSGQSDQRVRWDLAGQIADVFDQYIMYRPDWLMAWERDERGFLENEDPGYMHNWQPSFWKHLIDRWPETKHRAGLMYEWKDKLSTDSTVKNSLPPVIHIFNVKQVSPVLIEALIQCSTVVDVHWYLVDPIFSGEYDDRFFKGLNTEHYEFKALFDELTERCAGQVLRIKVGEGAGTVAPVLQKAGGVAVHRCHSAHREVEVLRDRLLELFRTTELRPHEVAIVTPDPDLYAPFMQEVFQIEGKDGIHVPVRINSGRKSERVLIIEVLLQAIHLAGTRFKVTEVFDWMGQAPILGSYMDKHGLRPLLNRWIEEQMIRWGSDKDHVSTEDFELNGRHTWSHGFERLLLAKVGSEDQDFEFGGVLSGSAVVTQAETEFLGRIMQVFDSLDRLRIAYNSSKTVGFWVDFLHDFIDLCIDPEWYEATELIRTQLFELKKVDELIRLEEVSLSIINSYLKDQLKKNRLGRSWHPGEITFTGMVALHSIPFKVVAIIGLNDGSLPGKTPISTFDLIPKFKRKGDRVRRLADRQLFLDYVLVPDHHLHLSYTGLRQTDNKVIAPSVMIPFMIDHLKRLSSGEKFYAPVEYTHRLQPFHQDYFNGVGAVQSFSKLSASLAEELIHGAKKNTGTLLPELTSDRAKKLTNLGPLSEQLSWNRDEVISVDRFLAYFSDPCKYVMNVVIGADLRDKEVPIEDDEPMDIDTLRAWKIRSEIVGSVVDDWVITGCLPTQEQIEDQFSLFIQKYELLGWVPDELAGQLQIAEILKESKNLILEFGNTVSGLEGMTRSTQELDLHLDLGGGLGLYLNGTLPAVVGDQYISLEVGKQTPAKDMKYWILHLLQNTISPTMTKIIYRSDTQKLIKFSSMIQEEALRHLRNLSWFYVLGHYYVMPIYASLCEQYLEKVQKGIDSLSSLYHLQDLLALEENQNSKLDDIKSEWVNYVWRDTDMLETPLLSAEKGIKPEILDKISEIDISAFTQIDAFRLFSEMIFKKMKETKAE